MSGHSKWHSIKHKKGAADKARGQLFAKLIRQIEVAAREGGGDVDGNPTLRAMVGKAREASVPIDTIERAIKRGTGELEGVRYETITYEGYAPHGVAILVECLSDNRNRTGAEIKNIFTRNGGSLAEPGAVAWQFTRRGVVMVEKLGVEEDELMLVALDAGADDIVDQGDTWQVTCPPTELHAVRTALEAAGLPIDSGELTMLPTTSVPLSDSTAARAVLRVMEALEEHDDVQNVHANFDIPDDVLAAVVACDPDGTVNLDEARDFVRAHHRAVLSTIRSDGRPQLSPVVCAVDDEGHVVVSTRETAVKVANLRRDPRVSLCVLNDGFFGAWVQVDGVATIVPMPEAMELLVDYYRRVSGEHTDWDEYRDAMQRERRVLVRIDLERAGPTRSG